MKTLNFNHLKYKNPFSNLIATCRAVASGEGGLKCHFTKYFDSDSVNSIFTTSPILKGFQR